MATLWSVPSGILPARIAANRARHLTTATLCILLTAALFACTATDEDSTNDERLLELEATVQSLQESLQATQNENTELNREIATLQQTNSRISKPNLKQTLATRSSGPRAIRRRYQKAQHSKELPNSQRTLVARSTTSNTPNAETAPFW